MAQTVKIGRVKGNMWYTNLTDINPLEGDMWFDKNTSSIYQYKNNEWVKIDKLPTKVSELINDADYTTKEYVDEEIPTKLSQLRNDANYATRDELPTKTSDLENDSKFATEEFVDEKLANVGVPTDLLDRVETLETNKANKTYVDGELVKKATYSYVDTKVADLINSAPETLDTLGELAAALEDNKDVVEALDEAISTKANKDDVPTKTSDLENDSKFATEEFVDEKVANAGVPTDLLDRVETLETNKANKTEIPTKVSQLSNDKGYLTSHQDISGKADITYVDTKVANLVNSAPETLDTLKELSNALGNDPNFATTVANQIGKKANKEDIPTKLSQLEQDIELGVEESDVLNIIDNNSQEVEELTFGNNSSVNWEDDTQVPSSKAVAQMVNDVVGNIESLLEAI